MRLWKAIILMDLALALGLILGYLQWERLFPRTRSEAPQAKQAGPIQGEGQQWTAQGVVRAVLPEKQIVILTHEELLGFMPPMTMGLRAASPSLYAGLQAGDRVRFTLKGVPPNVVITEISKEAGP